MKKRVEAGRNLAAVPILLLLAIAGGFVLRILVAPPELPAHATVLPSPAPLPDFELASQDGELFVKESFKGRWSMVFFGFTNCPDICPVTLQQLTIARRRMAEAEPDSIPLSSSKKAPTITPSIGGSRYRVPDFMVRLKSSSSQRRFET